MVLFLNLSHIHLWGETMRLRIKSGSAPGALLCAAGFISGCAAGVFISRYIGSAVTEEIYGVMKSYLESGHSVSTAANACLSGMILSVLVLISGFSVPGVFAAPALAAAKGFVISCSVSAMLRVAGSRWIGRAAIIFGTDAVLTLPFFFALCALAFSASGELLMRGFGRRMGQNIYGGGFCIRAAGCLGAEFAVRLALIMCFSRLMEF